MDPAALTAAAGSEIPTQAQAPVDAASPQQPTAADVIVKREVDGDEPMESPRDAADPPRWNRDEHARFMQALETFGGERTGDEWRKIAAFVQTRSLEEVRVHGQQYLQHLVQIHQLQQQQLHQQQHLYQQHQHQQRLLHLSRMSGEAVPFPLTTSTTETQSDPNGATDITAPTKSARSNEAANSLAGPSPLSVAAQSVANAMNARAVQPVAVRKPPSHVTAGGEGGGGGSGQRGKPKTWTFHEDKVMETTLAAWQRGKPYSWPKIAASLPGKTAKDVRLRYEQLVDDIASIETGHLTSLAPTLPPPPPPKIQSVGRPPPHTGLSSRIAPPPPIQVPPLPSSRAAKTDSPGIFPGSTRGRFAITPSFGGGASGMLSPTFLEFLASEDKPSLPGFAVGLTDLPSPLLPSPLGLNLHTTPGGGGGSARGSRRSFATPRGATPRIWHDFLADDFKIEPKGPRVSAVADAASGGGVGDSAIPASVSADSGRRSDDTKRE